MKLISCTIVALQLTPFLFLPCFNGNPFNKKGDPLAAFSKIQKISFNTF